MCLFVISPSATTLQASNLNDNDDEEGELIHHSYRTSRLE